MVRFNFLIILIVLFTPGEAQKLSTARIQKLSLEKLPKALADFRIFLGMPNDGNYREQVQTNLDWCRATFLSKGFEVTELPTEGMPLLLAELKSKKSARTVLFYIQIDGQPADAATWSQENPFIAVVKEMHSDGTWHAREWPSSHVNPQWRVYARSAADSKGPAMMLMQALDIIREQKKSILNSTSKSSWTL